MKPNKRILIVEDEAILFKRLEMILNKEDYEVLDFTPTYQEAIYQVNSKNPDIVLLDINLKGDKSGLDVGQELNKLKIPFIYVTELDSERIFNEGLKTNHSYFVVKTKPVLNEKEILRAIATVLNKSNNDTDKQKNAIFGLTNYLEKIKEDSSNKVSKVPVNFEDIILFTNIDILNTKINKAQLELNLKPNYICFKCTDQKVLLLKTSLIEILKKLPFGFVRINENYIINLLSKDFVGRINGKKIEMNGRILNVSTHYIENFNRVVDKIYH
jgi:DNA-binding response OmpR family regulator